MVSQLIKKHRLANLTGYRNKPLQIKLRHRIVCIFFACILFQLVSFCSVAQSLGTTSSKLSLTSAEQAWLNEHKEINIGISPDWPPFEYLDDKGQYQGLCADYFRLVTKKLGIKFNIKSSTDPWSTVLKKIANKN